MVCLVGETRALIPRDDDPAPVTAAAPIPTDVIPATPPGVEVTVPADDGTRAFPPPRAQPWAGWPAEWETPNWGGRVNELVDVAWAAIDLNASVTAAMPPYLVNRAQSLDTAWLTNPDPDRYGSWESFWYDMWWDFQAVGEAFLLATARYQSGYPARFHVVPPPLFDVELDDAGLRRYTLGDRDVTGDVLHLRYRATTQDPHGRGPLDAAGSRLVAAGLLARYLRNLMQSGGTPTQVLTVPDQLTAEQAAALQEQWITARIGSLGVPAVLSGGVSFDTPTLNPKDLALLDLAGMTEARLAIMLRVPPFLLALPSSGDSMVYNTAALTLDFHWRAHLRPLVRRVIAPLSQWLTPAGTGLELDRDDYIRPDPVARAQYYEIMVRIGALTVEEVRELERFANSNLIGKVAA
jgi:HK97 family phage portal protein